MCKKWWNFSCENNINIGLNFQVTLYETKEQSSHVILANNKEYIIQSCGVNILFTRTQDHGLSYFDIL